MARAWVAVVIVALAANAHGEVPPCDQVPPIIVVTKTEITRVDRGKQPAVYVGMLAEERDAAIGSSSLAAPHVAAVRVLLEPQPLQSLPVASLAVDATHDADTERLRVRIRDRLNHVATTVLPRDQRLCKPQMRLAAGRAIASVTAIDRAGNESAPTEVVIRIDDPTIATELANPTAGEPRGSCEAANHVLFVILGPLLVLAIALAILLLVTRRPWWRAATNEVVSLVVADHLGRSALRRATSLVVASAAAIVAAGALHNPIASVAVSLFASVPLSTLVVARRVVRLLETAGAEAEIRESMLVVTSPAGSARLGTSARALERARRSALPVAAVER